MINHIAQLMLEFSYRTITSLAPKTQRPKHGTHVDMMEAVRGAGSQVVCVPGGRV